MKPKKLKISQLQVFSKWSGKANAAFLSLKKIIKIGVLPSVYTILTFPLLGQVKPDTIQINRQIDLDEINIIGQLGPVTMKQNARFVTVIDSSEIAQKPVTSFQDILEYTAGIDLRQRNENGVQSDVSMRGGTFDQVMILLNGVNVTDAQTGHHNLNLPISAQDIERVEVLNGPGARLFGDDAFSGAINFVTKPNVNEIFRGSVTGGQHGYLKVHAGTNFKFRKTDNYISGSFARSDGHTSNTDFERFNAFYHGITRINNSTTSLQLGVSGKGFGANSFYSPKFPDQYEETSTGFGSVSFESGIHFPVSITAYFRRHYDHFLLKRDDPQFYENFHRTDRYGINSHISYSSRFGTTTAGFNFKADEILSSLLGNEISPQVKVRGTDSTYYSVGAETYHYHLFAEQSINTDRWYLSLGFMAGTNSFLNNQINIYPGIDVAYWLTKEIKLSASVQKTLRTPTYTDLYYTDPSTRGNENLRPEEAIGLDAGLKMYKGKWTWQAFYYHQSGNNHIAYVWQPEQNYRLAKNIENVKVHGLETNLKFQPDVRWLSSVNIGYAYNSTDKSLDELPDNLKHKLVTGFKHEILPKLQMYWNVRYMEREGSFITYNTADDTFPLIQYEPFWLIDAKISYRFNFTRIFMNLTNVLNTSYHEITSLTQPGRWLKIGIEMKIDR